MAGHSRGPASLRAVSVFILYKLQLCTLSSRSFSRRGSRSSGLHAHVPVLRFCPQLRHKPLQSALHNAFSGRDRMNSSQSRAARLISAPRPSGDRRITSSSTSVSKSIKSCSSARLMARSWSCSVRLRPLLCALPGAISCNLVVGSVGAGSNSSKVCLI